MLVLYRNSYVGNVYTHFECYQSHDALKQISSVIRANQGNNNIMLENRTISWVKLSPICCIHLSSLFDLSYFDFCCKTIH